MRVVFLWKGLSGHFGSCLRALAKRAEVSVVYSEPVEEAPFGDLGLEGSMQMIGWSDAPPSASQLARVIAGADVVVASSWNLRSYVQACSAVNEPVCIMAADNPWRGTVRQRIGIIAYRLRLRRAFDGAWASGEPQIDFMERLGFDPATILDHMCCCDVTAFRTPPGPGVNGGAPFLYVGRLLESKGVPELLDAYGRYRDRVEAPRGLRLVGTGPLSANVERAPGVDLAGFVQPVELPDHFRGAAVFVLPSKKENWGVVVQEAACASLPLLVSTDVYAHTRFLDHGVNGLLFDAGSPESLADAMVEIDRWDVDRMSRARETSHALGTQITPEGWAEILLDGAERIRRHR